MLSDSSSPTLQQVPHYAKGKALRLELKAIPSEYSSIDRFEIRTAALRQLPFFLVLDQFMEEFFSLHGITEENISYAIWGGVAANLVLMATGRTKDHFSLHDIEMFLTRQDLIYQPEALSDIFNREISGFSALALEVGGISISKRREGISVHDFQRDRILLRDGDLYLNNLLLFVDRVGRKVRIEAPTGIIPSLVVGGITIEMKDASDLRHIDRIARRIYRNVGKLIRFEQVAGLTLTANSRIRLKNLIDLYWKKLDEYFFGLSMQDDERKVTTDWISNAKISSVEGGRQFLYTLVLSETAKRLAGLLGITSIDHSRFCNLLWEGFPGISAVSAHPLTDLVRRGLNDSDRPLNYVSRMAIERKCYEDFLKYQKPGAERLHGIYSLQSGSV